MHNPPQVRLALLITCTKCGGEGYYDDENGDPCNCPRCEDGWEAASVAVSTLLSICRPTAVAADCYAELAQVLTTQKPTGHSLLRHLADDLPQAALQKLRGKRPTLSGLPISQVNNVEQSGD